MLVRCLTTWCDFRFWLSDTITRSHSDKRVNDDNGQSRSRQRDYADEVGRAHTTGTGGDRRKSVAVTEQERSSRTSLSRGQSLDPISRSQSVAQPSGSQTTQVSSRRLREANDTAARPPTLQRTTTVMPSVARINSTGSGVQDDSRLVLPARFSSEPSAGTVSRKVMHRASVVTFDVGHRPNVADRTVPSGSTADHPDSNQASSPGLRGSTSAPDMLPTLFRRASHIRRRRSLYGGLLADGSDGDSGQGSPNPNQAAANGIPGAGDDGSPDIREPLVLVRRTSLARGAPS